MKSSAKRLWPLLPMAIWIVIWVAVAAIAAYFSKIHELYLLAIMCIIDIAEMIWYYISSSRNEETGVINKVANWFLLDFIAVPMIDHWFRIKKAEEQKANTKNAAYKKQAKEDLKIDADNEDEEEWDVNLADWEKEILKKKNKKKYDSLVKKEKTDNIVDVKIQEERRVIRGFGVYLLFLIYKKDPDIVNTYKIISQYKEMVENDNQRKQLINDFINTDNLGTFIEDFKPKTMTKKMLNDVLVQTVPQEFVVALNQDRVQMQIDAKDNWFDRVKTKKSNKKSTK